MMKNYLKMILFLTVVFGQISLTKNNDQSYAFYDGCQTIGILESDFYARAVASLPIVCIDVVVYNPETKCYLLILRENPPSQDTWWVPGGRIYKGESFFHAAVGKCKQELGIVVEPKKILGVYSTIFPDSVWECPTHSVNVAIFAVYSDNQNINLDDDHMDYKWQPIALPHDNPYVEAVCQRALEYVELMP